MPRSRDTIEHDATKAQIKAIARAQMAEHGTAGLSLRAIARALEVTAPALYRYFPSLDSLITALIVDAFNGLADAIEAADRAVVPQGDYEARLLAAALAYRRFAQERPTDFELIFGNPIPGYVAPGAITIPAATRTNVALTAILIAAKQAGAYRSPYQGPFALTAAALARTEQIAADYDVPVDMIVAGLGLWSMVHGAAMLELHGHLDPIIDGEAFCMAQVRLFFSGGAGPPH
jgi:AcrR family transcriptional regulator